MTIHHFIFLCSRNYQRSSLFMYIIPSLFLCINKLYCFYDLYKRTFFLLFLFIFFTEKLFVKMKIKSREENVAMLQTFIKGVFHIIYIYILIFNLDFLFCLRLINWETKYVFPLHCCFVCVFDARFDEK